MKVYGHLLLKDGAKLWQYVGEGIFEALHTLTLEKKYVTMIGQQVGRGARSALYRLIVEENGSVKSLTVSILGKQVGARVEIVGVELVQVLRTWVGQQDGERVNSSWAD